MIAPLSRWLLREPVVGLDIRHGSISTAVASARSKGGYTLRMIASMAYDPSGGEKALVHALRRLWRSTDLGTYSVCSCLHTYTLFTKAFRLRHVSTDELESALLLEAEQALSLTPDRIAFDWMVQQANADPTLTEGILVASPRAELDRHLQVFRGAGLYPLALDVPGMAVAHLYEMLRGPETSRETAVVALDEFGAECVTIADDGFRFPRSVQWAGRRLTDDPNDLAREIIDTLRYTTFALRKPQVRQIALTGCQQHIEPLAHAIASRSDIPVIFWNPIEELRPTAKARRSLQSMDPVSASRMAVCLGLALREEPHVAV